MQKEGNKLVLQVADNGPGFSEDKLTGSNSFGYKIIKAFLPKLNGSLNVASKNGAVVTVTVENYKLNNG